jgi:hypothetical protein
MLARQTTNYDLAVAVAGAVALAIEELHRWVDLAIAHHLPIVVEGRPRNVVVACGLNPLASKRKGAEYGFDKRKGTMLSNGPNTTRGATMRITLSMSESFVTP